MIIFLQVWQKRWPVMQFPKKEEREEEESRKGVALNLLISQFSSGLAKTLAGHGISPERRGGRGRGGGGGGAQKRPSEGLQLTHPREQEGRQRRKFID